MAINKKKVEPYRHVEMRKEAHANFMGGPSYDISSPLLRLICMSASSFFGEPSYYKGDAPKFKKGRGGHAARMLNNKQRDYLRKLLNAIDDNEWRNMSPRSAMEKAIDEALDHDPAATLRWATTLRRDEYIRTTPQVILVRAAQHPKVRGTQMIRTFAPAIIARADEPATQLAYLLDAYGKPIPNALKRAWSDYLIKCNDYQLAKYRMENRVVKTVDVANLAFGFGGKNQDGAVGKLLRGELTLGNENKTWESIISAGGKWEEAIEVMGHMALLRNLRNFLQKKVPPELWLKKLVNTAERGKQLPFRYLSAFDAVKNIAPGFVLDTIEECLEISVGNLPTLNGRSLVLTDNSGSAHGCPVSEMSTMSVAQIGNLMGVLTGKISDEGMLGVFGDRLKEFQIRKRASIMDQTNEANRIGRGIGGATENGIWLALDQAIKHKEHWDNIFVYSDMQAGHGGLFGQDSHKYRNYLWKGGYGNRYIDVPKLIHEYRSKVNAKVNVFLVQIAGYEDTLLPEYYDRTYIIGGWSGSILKFAKRMIDTADQYQQ
jgi:hypothetical protein